MEKIVPGKYFDFMYDLYRVNEDGTETLMHQVDREEPERAIFGVTQGFVKALEDGIAGLKPGDRFNITAAPEDGFGPYDKDDVVTLSRDRFLIDGKFDEEAFAPGEYVPMMTADGYRIDGLIREVTPTDVIVDFNHPLANDTIRFEGEIITVRDATPEELHPSGGCGCHGGCGDNTCGCGSNGGTGSCGCHGGGCR